MVLETLRTDYEQCREDIRHFWNLTAALLGVAAVILPGLGFLLARGCSAPAAACIQLPEWLWVILPLAPAIVLGFFIQQAAVASMRNVYLKALENELHVRSNHVQLSAPTPEAASFVSELDIEGLQVPASVRLFQPLLDSTKGPGGFPALFIFLNVVPAFLVLAGTVSLLLKLTSGKFEIVWISIYSILYLVLLIPGSRLLRVTQLWNDLRARFEREEGW